MRPIFYDTETTGVRAEKDRIVEIAAYDPVENRVFESFVNPGCPISLDATAIHRITDAMVASAPSFAQVGLDFAEFCQGEIVLIAHNNDGFDVHFLREEYKRHSLAFPQWKFLDSLKWARRYRPDIPRHTLQFLREIYCIAENNAHRALEDVKVLAEVFACMTDDLPFHEVYKLLNRTRQLQHMPFGKHQGKPLAQLPKDYVTWLAGSGAFDKPDNQELKSSLLSLGLLAV